MPDERLTTFRARVRPAQGAVVVVAEGELDIVGAPHLIETVPEEGAEPVVLDLDAVRFMDSSGLRALLEVRQACADAGRPFVLARPSEAVRRVLELVDLEGEFEIVEAPPV